MKETPPSRCKYFRKCDDCPALVGYFSRTKPPLRCPDCRVKAFHQSSQKMFMYSRYRSIQKNFLYDKERKEYGK